MFKLERALKTYREAGSLNAQVNLFGFIDDHTFLTKSGDLGLVLADSKSLKSRQHTFSPVPAVRLTAVRLI